MIVPEKRPFGHVTYSAWIEKMHETVKQSAYKVVEEPSPAGTNEGPPITLHDEPVGYATCNSRGQFHSKDNYDWDGVRLMAPFL